MGKLMDTILKPRGDSALTDHLQEEDIARMAEGNVSGQERQAFISHLNACPQCYQIFQQTLHDVDFERSESSSWWSRNSKQVLALAACLILAVAIGGGFYQYYGQEPQTLLAYLPMDGEIKNLVLEGSEQGWDGGDRAALLVKMLKERKVKVGDAKQVIMVAAYIPTKDLFGPKETLKIRVEKGVIYLEVVSKDEQKQQD